MKTINISEKKEKIKWDYDAEADVLYISFGKPQNAEGVDIGEGTIVRVQTDTNEITGLTIINPLHRTLKSLSGKKTVGRKKKIPSSKILK
ncbi:MAG: DUF2283 domain-containing protein [Prolixibacteraceae bacterium]|nr:DUF2283 domain-containing protein [Prolixibacteraceae bacterium]